MKLLMDKELSDIEAELTRLFDPHRKKLLDLEGVKITFENLFKGIGEHVTV